MDIPMWTVILGICGGIITILNTVEKLVGAGKAINAPNHEQDRRITNLETRCDEFDRYLRADKQRIEDLEMSLSMLMKVEFALLSHAINGNDLDKLKDVQSEMLDYLSKRGISI